MQKQYSISVAKNKLPTIIHSVEDGSAVELTRHGKPVAVLVSFAQYQGLVNQKKDFWTALTSFKKGFPMIKVAWNIWLTLSGQKVLCVKNVIMINIVKEKTQTLSTFGYTWRALIAFNLALLLAVLIKLMLGIKTDLPSIQFSLIIASIQFLLIIVITWLFYSTNRKSQFMWFTQIFRGT